ncbi:hypothetical protein LTR84_011353 [Exophiala bonariae]|uniref:Transmembrane protein n=1 Tax=Exophiala bonariae TaxID=1690606 RepID=A0AAV9MUV3_9EURO|nr:hypothetical protein LTR84_011353 [Exophiala bonariae]
MAGLRIFHSLLTKLVIGMFILATSVLSHAFPKAPTLAPLPVQAIHATLLNIDPTAQDISRAVRSKELVKDFTEEETGKKLKSSNRLSIGIVFGILGAVAIASSYFAWRHERKEKESRKALQRLRKLWKHSIRRKKTPMPVKSPEHDSTETSIDIEYFCREHGTTNNADSNDNGRLGSSGNGFFRLYRSNISPGMRRNAVQTV